MEPRLLFRTHYQVDEPAYMEFLVKRCTSPIQSAYPERAAACLKGQIEERCQTRFNLAASHYALDLGRALGLMTPNNTWTDRGHLVNLVAEVNGGEPEEQLSLNDTERLLHFRLFFESDGAAFIFIARYFAEHGSLALAEAISSSFVEDMFVQIFSAYLSATSSPAERVALRARIDELRSRGYGGRTGLGKTRHHKVRVHVQTLYRLGLLERANASGRIVYKTPVPNSGNDGGLQRLLSEVPDIVALEDRIASRQWPEIAAKTLDIPSATHRRLGRENEQYILCALIDSYREVMSLGTPVCPLSTIIEATQIIALTQRRWLLDYTEVFGLLSNERDKSPGDIRFHVDRRGRPAFINISDEWRTDFEHQRSNSTL